MSKKNKIQKQLLKAQIERNAQALASGKTIEQIKPMSSINQNSPSVIQNEMGSLALPRELTEVTLIRKDIRMSLLLITIVIVFLIVIYFIDKSNPFLLRLANQIFQILQK